MVAPYGSWASPISAAHVAAGLTTYDAVHMAGDAVYWLESRPVQGGHTVLVRWTRTTGAVDILPPDVAVGTWVNEYGGGAYLPTASGVFVCNARDDRVYRLEADRSLLAITPPNGRRAMHRYADLRLVPGRDLLVAVRERHEGGAALNEIVAMPTDGSREPWPLVGGHDLMSFPRPSPDGSALAWITTDLPNMPWDGGELWVAPLGGDGRLGPPQLVAGGRNESVFQPEWSPAGELHFVSDHSGWWNLYRYRDQTVGPLIPMEAEFGEAQWEFDYSTFAFLDRHRIACRYRTGVTDRLATVDTRTNELVDLILPVTSVKPYVRATGDRVTFVGAAPTRAPSMMSYAVSSKTLQVLAEPGGFTDSRYISVPEEIEFLTDDGGFAHALYYPPTNPDVRAPVDHGPPLIVHPHPGPTADAKLRLDLRIQYFTSRGFAVVAVNYRGSTGYGRRYREELVGRWGVADVEDCAAAALHLVRTKGIDPRRIVISGASAGGFTSLAAAAATDIFAAAVSTFGVTDLEAHRLQSPRFQAFKLDRLVGPYAEVPETYRIRSPVHQTDKIRCPILLMHGAADTVVPPSHSRAMAAALDRERVPYAYLEFPDEGHGFRSTRTVCRAMEAELFFYAAVLGLGRTDRLEPVELRTYQRSAS
jgi:dipeptidyl aminopeptidase/acylaminoacyl peptidase